MTTNEDLPPSEDDSEDIPHPDNMSDFFEEEEDIAESEVDIKAISTKYNPPDIVEENMAGSFTPEYFPFLTAQQLQLAMDIWGRNSTVDTFKELQAIASNQLAKDKSTLPDDYDKLLPFYLGNQLESDTKSITNYFPYEPKNLLLKVFKDIFTLKSNPFTVFPNLLKRLLKGILGNFSSKDSLESVQAFHNKFAKTLMNTMSANPIKVGDPNSRAVVKDDPFVLLLKDKQLDPNIMFAASLSALELLHTSARNVVNTDESINSIFGVNSDLGVTPNMRDLFGSGRSMNREATNVGKSFMSMLGIKSDNIIMQRKLEIAAGLHIIRALLEAEYLDASFVHKDIMSYYFGKRDKAEPIVPLQGDIKDFIKGGTYFVTIASKDGELTKEVKTLLKDTKRGLTELGKNLDINFNKNLPSSKPYSKSAFEKRLGTTWKDSYTEYDDIERKILRKYSNIAHSIITRASQHPLTKVDDFMVQIGLGHGLNDHVLDVNKKAEDSKRLQLSNDLQAVRDSEEIAEESKVVYFFNQLIKQGRVQMSGGSQNNKLMRWLFAPEEMKRTIKFDDSDESKHLQEAFKKAVVAGFGTKINQVSPEEITRNFEAIVKDLEPIKNIFNKEEFTSKDTDKILKAIWKGGERYHTYAAMLDTIEWMKGKEFTSHLYREDDGIANGMAIGYLAFNGGNDPEVLSGVAIFHNANQTYVKYREHKDANNKAVNKDPYELLASQAEFLKSIIKRNILEINNRKNNKDDPIHTALILLRTINQTKNPKDKETLNAQLREMFRGKEPAIQGFGSAHNFTQAANFIFENKQLSNDLLLDVMDSIENLDEEIGRSWARDPTMQIVYGSGADTIATNIGYKAIERLYAKLTAYMNSSENKNELVDIEKEIEHIAKVNIGISKLLNITDLSEEEAEEFGTLENKAIETLKKFKLDPSVQKKIVKQFEVFYTPIIEQAIQDKWGRFIQNRRKINSEMNLGNSILKSVIELEITKVINESMVDNDGYAVFTKGDLEKVYAKFESIMPAINVLGIDGKPKLLHFWGMDSTNKADPLFRVQTNNKVNKKNVSIQYIDKDGIVKTKITDIDSKSDTGHAVEFILDDIGVKMPIMTIHYLDSLPVKNIMLSNYISMLVDDGFHGAMDETDKLSYIGNKTLFESINLLDPFQSTLKYFERLVSFVNDSTDPDLLKLIQTKLWDSLSDYQNSNVLQASDNPELLKTLLKNEADIFRSFAGRNSSERQKTLDSIEAFGNYGGNATFKPKISRSQDPLGNAYPQALLDDSIQ